MGIMTIIFSDNCMVKSTEFTTYYLKRNSYLEVKYSLKGVFALKMRKILYFGEYESNITSKLNIEFKSKKSRGKSQLRGEWEPKKWRNTLRLLKSI